ncbi:NlpC/P60 family protein [Pontibacterium sp.]|uniref:NlpC/P60 family protein n=1 Tax=Pontibacterium sp. TaxID=2036026 RepID=UPI0035185F9C
MRRLHTIITLFLAAAMLSGCSSVSYKPAPRPVVTNPALANVSSSQDVTDRMYQQYQQWKGTKYALGGLSKKGIDCSGFVYVTYREKLGIRLPRTTDHQSRIGQEIDRRNLVSGDLVFFKTGFKVRHVGIYIGEGKFLHASTSQGVTISRLDNVYWQDKYWHSRRVAF